MGVVKTVVSCFCLNMHILARRAGWGSLDYWVGRLAASCMVGAQRWGKGLMEL